MILRKGTMRRLFNFNAKLNEKIRFGQTPAMASGIHHLRSGPARLMIFGRTPAATGCSWPTGSRKCNRWRVTARVLFVVWAIAIDRAGRGMGCENAGRNSR